MKKVVFFLMFLALSVSIVHSSPLQENNYIRCEWINSLVYQNFLTEDFLNIDRISLTAHYENSKAEIEIYTGLDILDGKLSIEELEEILGQGENILETEQQNNTAGCSISTKYLDAWMDIRDRLPGGGFRFSSPEFYGFSGEIEAYRQRTGGLINLLKDYTLDCSLILDRFRGTLSWENSTGGITAGAGLTVPKIFSFRENTATDVHMQLDGGSDIDIFAGFDLNLTDDWSISENSILSLYRLRLAGAVNNLRFIDVYNPEDPNERVGFIINSHGLDFHNSSTGFHGGLSYRNIILPSTETNYAYFDATPLSPYGKLYRLRYILKNFSISINNLEFTAGQEIEANSFSFKWDTAISLFFWNINSTFYTVEGIAILPFMIWDLEQSPVQNLEENGVLLSLTPELSFSIPFGKFLLSIDARQLLPIYIDSKNISISDFNETGLNFWGGTEFELSLTIPQN